MNHEFKNILIENTDEYKSFVLNEIENASDENELLRLLDKIISIQYYKGLFNNPDEYDEIISNKIDEFYPENEFEFYDEIHEFRKFLKDLLESYDIFINISYKKLNEYSEIKISYLIDEYDSLYYLDELDDEYLDYIYVYDEFEYIDYIDEILLSCYITDRNTFEFIKNYFDYDSYIQDLIINDEISEYEYEYKTYYIENSN